MSNKGNSDTEEAVKRRLEAAQVKIERLERQLDDKISDYERQVLEYSIRQEKDAALKEIDSLLRTAPEDIKERCNQQVDQWQYPGQIAPEEQKDLDASQAILARNMYEKRYPAQELKHDTVKELDQSQEYAYQQRYGKDAVGKSYEAGQEKDLDQSQEYAFSLRYREQTQDEIDKAPDMEQEPDKELEEEPDI